MASVIGCIVVSMENYRDGIDEGNDLDSIDFDTLVQNLEVWICFSFMYNWVLILNIRLDWIMLELLGKFITTDILFLDGFEWIYKVGISSNLWVVFICNK